MGSYQCQTAGEYTGQGCTLERHSPRTWLAPGGAAQWFLGIELAPHSWGERSRSMEIKTRIRILPVHGINP